MDVVRIVLVVFVLRLVFIILLPTLTSDQFVDFIEKIGVWGSIFVVFYGLQESLDLRFLK